MSYVTLFVWLLVGHALCDYPLQGDFLARAKNHRSPIPGVPWYQALAAHSLIQAGAVWLITGSLFLGLCELVCHALIDWGKSDGAYGYDTDQALHVAVKLQWVLIVATGVPW